MEFFGEIDERLKPCHWCGKMTWIYVEKKENHSSGKMEPIFCCNDHYLEILKRYFEENEEIEFNLFPQELNILELPIQVAQVEFGTNIPVKYLIQMYLEKLEEKLKQINQDLAKFEKDLEPNNENFIDLLRNDKSEKEVLKMLCFILIREYKFS